MNRKRIKVSLTIDVDVEAWADEYGIEPEEVEADVRRWVAGRVRRYDDEVFSVVPDG